MAAEHSSAPNSTTLDTHIIILSTTILIVSFACCYIPIYLSSFKKFKKYFQYISALAVGLLLSVLIVDIVPHVILGPCLSGHSHSHSHSHSHGDSCGHLHGEQGHRHGHKYMRPALITSGITFIGLLAIDTLFLHHGECETKVKTKLHDESNKKENCEHKTEVERDHCHDELYNEAPESMGLCNTSSIKNSKSSLQALIFVAAISVHSFLEGLAVRTGKASSRGYEIALVVHKVLESIGLSISIQQTNFKPMLLLLLFSVFSIATPIAMLLSVLMSPDTLLFCLANGAAMGSVMFIVFVEMIPSLFHGHSSKKGALKLFLFLVCFIISSLLLIRAHDYNLKDLV